MAKRMARFLAALYNETFRMADPNIAFALRGAPCTDMLRAEGAVLALSGGVLPSSVVEPVLEGDQRVSAQYLTEGQIQRGVLEELSSVDAGDHLDIAMFYLSDRTVVQELLHAARRGVTTRVILDPNKDAFGRQKGGIPNRQVAWELVTRSEGAITIRWYDTHGEQFHTKLMLAWHPDHVTAVGGSANLTRRNLDDFNLEADFRIQAPRGSPLADELGRYFERLWTNMAGDYTVDYSEYEDRSWLKRLVYRVQEWTGFSSY